MLISLPNHAEATDPDPFAGPGHPIRKLTRAVATGKQWRPDHAERMSSLFDGLAPEWAVDRGDPIRCAPIADAFDRGDLPVEGDWLEVGSGTGNGTSFIADRVGSVVATDLSAAMLAHSVVSGPKVRTDASTLSFRTDGFDAVMMINMLLFPAEVHRVVRPGGSVLWVNTLGDQTPIHLPASEVLEALPGVWSGVTARAGTGFWLTARRRDQ